MISGIVGLAGGLGGFILPIMFGALMDLTGIRLERLHADVRRGLGPLIWMYWTASARCQLMGARRSWFSA